MPGGYRLWVDASAQRTVGEELPVLWLLDGATLFPLVSATLGWLTRRPDTTGITPMLLAAIDHAPADRNRRYFDYSFEPPDDPAGQVVDVPSGGGPAFANLLAESARVAVSAAFAADPDRHTLLGHSLGGLFALRMRGVVPNAFAVIGAISPSLWWNGSVPPTQATGALFLGAGSEEEPGVVRNESEARRRARRMVSNLDAFAKAQPSGNVMHDIAEGHDHASAVPALLPAFLRFASIHLKS